MEEKAHMRAFDFNGAGEILFVDKPLGWTSFDVIKRIRMSLHIAKAGHAGTLDPKATGLLIVCTGKQTKSIDQFVGLEKEYTGTFELGISTASFDMETPVLERKEYNEVTLESLTHVTGAFVGKQLQMPPMYSAVKFHGKPLYKFARKGKEIVRASKEIEIMKFDIVSFVPPRVEFRVVCSKGTYIRSLVNDVGVALGCGASLTSLRRTRIGSHIVAEALTMETIDRWREELSAHSQMLDEDCVPA